jgi:predicted transcriptional regulator
MDDYIVEALAIVKAQASTRIMTEEEIISMIKKLSHNIRAIATCAQPAEEFQTDVDATKSIKEKSVSCLECGKTFKILSARHLALHGLTAEEYKEKWGLKQKTPLIAKALLRERRKKMKEMRLWERRKKA